MSDGTYISWEEVQRLMLPPNSTMLIPPPPEPVDVPALASGSPQPRPDWLDDAFAAGNSRKADDPTPQSTVAPADPRAVEASDGPVRLLAHLIAYNAVLEYVMSPSKKDDEIKDADQPRDRRNKTP